jgi:hypothetical protein
MRHHLVELVERRPWEREQAVIDADDRLADEVQAVPEEQVVRLVDAPACELSNGTRPAATRPTSTASTPCESTETAAARVGEDRERAFLRICTCLTLVRDDGHARSLRAGLRTVRCRST